MRTVKVLLVAGLLASLLHFADNTFAIDRYPEPRWITPIGVAISWCVVSAPAVVALTRRRAGTSFFSSAGIYAVLLLGGLLHYVFGAPMDVPLRSNITVLAEALCGAALGAALLIARRRYASAASVGN
jgi:cbb3-type cytochrome oxidase subunit 1